MLFWGILALIAFLVIILIILKNIRIVKKNQVYIIERLYSYHKTWTEGKHLLFPFIDKVVKVFNTREQERKYESKTFLTSDGTTIFANISLFFQVENPELYCYSASNPVEVIDALLLDNISNVIGNLEYEEVMLKSFLIDDVLMVLNDKCEKIGISCKKIRLDIKPVKDAYDEMSYEP